MRAWGITSTVIDFIATTRNKINKFLWILYYSSGRLIPKTVIKKKTSSTSKYYDDNKTIEE